MIGQLRHQKRRGERVELSFNVWSSQGAQGSQPSITLTSVYNDDEGNNHWLPFDLTVEEARRLANRLIDAAAKAAQPLEAA